MDRLRRRGIFLSHDFGLPRIWLSSVVQFGGLDSIHLSSGISYSSAWAWYLMGRSPQILWPHNSPSKSCCPDPRTGRRILTFSGLHHGRLSFVPPRVPEFLWLPMAHSWCFSVRCASPLMFPLWGIMRTASKYGRHIQWCLYEAARIWRLKAPLGTR